ncbi:MAG: hypothetical protein KGI54_14785 [Pseudomonadota bacterium]|nr:hypothetical protein [Pseudomonadota bacterium]
MKSHLEDRVKALLPDYVQYEPDRLPYLVEHTYKPDFKLRENVYIEAKGLFLPADRAKHLYIKEQHPDVTIYFLFQDSNKKLNRSSKTTYGMWAEKYGYEYSDIKAGIPEHWINPPATKHTTKSKGKK